MGISPWQLLIFSIIPGLILGTVIVLYTPGVTIGAIIGSLVLLFFVHLVKGK